MNISITDIIDHRNKYGTQRFLVINRLPNFIYERKGAWLYAEDSGFFSFYKYEKPSGSFYAFAGRKFDIQMKDGSTIKAYGQWWDGVPLDYQGLLSYEGYSTAERLAECNVFTSGNVDPLLVEKWLSENEPSNNYDKYRKNHKNHGKHKIISKWDDQ